MAVMRRDSGLFDRRGRGRDRDADAADGMPPAAAGSQLQLPDNKHEWKWQLINLERTDPI
jgi:hypothetical protein